MSTNQQMNSPRRTSLAAGLATLLGLVLLAFPAGAAQPKKLKEVPLMEARHDLPEHQLLDAGVQVFEHGLPIDEDALFELEAKGISDDVRKSEARYIPVRLKDTLRRTGFWDAVRVVPGGMDSQHLTVSGRIEESNGKRLVLAVSAVDATGRVWLDKRYRQRADDRAYRASKDGEHYSDFAFRIDEPYSSWRTFSFAEIVARGKARRQTRARWILTGVAILGGGLGTSMLGSGLFLESTAASLEAAGHAEALRELTRSFDGAMEPLLIEIEGRTLRLTGSAEAQYAAWRELLREIFVAETGLSADPDTDG